VSHVLIHIGLHKTATTWLQRHLFERREAGFGAPWSIAGVIDHIVRPHPLEWDERAAQRLIDEGRRSAESRRLIPVLSNEELGGNPHSGSFNNTIIADRLARLAPDARVLIVIRRQTPMLVSTYKQYVIRGGVLSPRRYFRPLAGSFRVPTFRAGHYEYHRLIECYHDRFGRERVRVLAMEAMLEDRRTFVREIVDYSGCRDLGPLPEEPVRRSHSAATSAVQRRLNRLLLRDDVNPAAPLRVLALRSWMAVLDRVLSPWPGRMMDGRLEAFVDSFARGRYAASNRRTAEITGLPLDRYGYDV